MRVLLSIKPEYATKILTGEKRFEYRRRVFSRTVSAVVVYATSPTRKLVGEFQVDAILDDCPASLWQATAGEGGVTADQFFAYFDGCARGYALRIAHVTKYPEPVDPGDVFKDFRAPQSFAYIA